MDPEAVLQRLCDYGDLPPHISALDDIVRPQLEEHLAAVGGGRAPSDSKAFKDAVWGMIDFDGREVAVLDSPVLQRLRRVRQLGLGYLTYPTAGYSRFEHTLGAVNQSERMLRAVALRSEPRLRNELLEAREIVRLAALLHDVGHLPLSHVSERYFDEVECGRPELASEASAITRDMSRALEIERPRLAEGLSVLIIATPSFRGFLEERAGYSAREIAAAALAIVGREPEPRLLFVSQLITNVIDADKLDYMFRDGWVTGVPLAVDLERLLYKLKCLEVSADQLPEDAGARIPRDARPLVLGTDVAGDRLAYDLAQARIMLFERVYFHHKTRAAERVALRALDALALSAVKLLAYDDDLFGHVGAIQHQDSVGPYAHALLQRHLPRRGFALSYGFARPGDPEFGLEEPQFVAEWAGLKATLSNALRRRELEERVQVVAAGLATELTRQAPETIWIDTQARPIGAGDSRLLVIRPDGSFGGDQGFAPAAAANTYEPLDISHVFASGAEADARLAYLATEIVLAEDYGLYFERSAADYAKVDWSEVEDQKRLLEEKHPRAFENLGWLRPLSRAARTGAMVPRLRAIAEKFQQFSTDRQIRITEDRILRFLDQFPEDLVVPMVEALERTTYLDRFAVGAQFAGDLAQRERDGAVLVPLTSDPSKSASHLPYYFADAGVPLNIVALPQALETESDIVLFDDVLVSGTQLSEVLDAWFGEGEPELAVALSSEEQAALKARTVEFRFAWAWRKGLDRLDQEARRHGVAAAAGALRVDETEDDLAILLGDGGDRLRDFLGEVGEHLLLTTRAARAEDPWSPEKCRENALGYGNSERLVVTAYNVPAGTVTALWKYGSFRNAPWLPLFPRRLNEPPSKEEQPLAV